MKIDPHLFYRYDNQWFRTKWEIFNYAATQKNPTLYTEGMQCVLNKDYGFDEFDWTVEPSESWEEICVQRLLKIRDTYPKICLFYSGGSDSHYILTLFLKYNIKLDEICNHQIHLKGIDTKWFNHECIEYAVPFVKEHCSHIPFNLINFTDWSLWTDEKSFTFDSPAFNRGLQVYVNPFRGINPNIIDEYTKRGFVVIHGGTEPHVYYDKEKDKYYAELWDTENFADRCGSPNMISFFTDPAEPQVHAKQCHLVKNELRRLNLRELDSNSKNPYYKTIYCSVVRDGYRTGTESPQYEKAANHAIFRTKKEEYMFKQFYKYDKRIFEKYTHFLNAPVKGVPLYRLPKGAIIGKWYLE